MKSILLLLAFSFLTMASNWMPISKIQPGATSAFELKSDCEKSGEVCLDVIPEVVKLGYFSLEDVAQVGEAGDEDYAPATKSFVVDQSALSAHQAGLALIATKEAEKKNALARMDHGRGVIALVLVQNSKKVGLTNSQIAQINGTFAQIKGLLDTGSLNTAKDAINAITPDGVLVTQEDKDIYLAEINAYPGL